MKKLMIATLIAAVSPFASASSYYVYCSTADGRITNVTGHDFKTVVKYYDYEANKDIEVELNGEAYLEEVERVSTIEKESHQSDCKNGNSGWASAKETYVIKGKLILPDNASEKLKGVVGPNPEIFLCQTDYSSPVYCGE